MRLLVALGLLLCTARVRADVTSPSAARSKTAQAEALPDETSSSPGPPSLERAVQLRELRLRHVEERRREGWWLLGWGLANAVAGTLTAALGRDHEALLAAGVTGASFGAINAVLALGLMDGKGRRKGRLEAEPLTSATFYAQREHELVAQLGSAQAFALNTGLDVFYIASGMLLYALGRVRSDADGWEEGTGLALAAQGAFLLGFDVVGWKRSRRRARMVRALR